MAEGYTQTISTAELNETPRINLEQPTGDVYVEVWDKPEIEVSISDKEGYFEIVQEGSNITIRNSPNRGKVVNFREPEGQTLRDVARDLARSATSIDERNIERTIERTMRKMGKFGINIDVNLGNWRGGRDYHIRTPHNTHLNLRTSSGDIKVEGVTGTILCQASSGDLKLHDVGGNLLLSSSSGDVTIHRLQGKLGVRTASGDIRTKDLELEELSLNTASGDVNLDLASLPEKTFEVRTVSGDLHLYMPLEAGFRLETRTISGSINSGFSREQVKYQSSGKRETSLEVNGGGSLRVQASTVSGDISINPRKEYGRSTEGETAGAMTTNLAQNNHGDRTQPEGYVSREQAKLEIFQQVERGELSAQQALEAITRLG